MTLTRGKTRKVQVFGRRRELFSGGFGRVRRRFLHARLATLAGVTDPLVAAIAFLRERQRADGAFDVRVSLDLRADEGESDPSLFATAFIVRALQACGDRPDASSLLPPSLAFLASHMEQPGVWRHWTSAHSGFAGLPPDADDTAVIASLLAQSGIRVPRVRRILLANRAPDGLFYTWLLPRWGQPSSREMWRVGLRRLRWPVHGREFWRRTSAAPDDVDCVVNAHVLGYLGPGAHAEPIVRRLTEVIRAGTETTCDKWYRSAFVLHAAVARCAAAGIAGFSAVRDDACAYLAAAVRPDGSVGEGAVDAACAILALALWDAGVSERRRAARWLMDTQAPDGSWPSEPVYYGGPDRKPEVPSWGSRELTTGLCVDALCRLL